MLPSSVNKSQVQKKAVPIKFPQGPFTKMEKQGIKEGGIEGEGGKELKPRNGR